MPGHMLCLWYSNLGDENRLYFWELYGQISFVFSSLLPAVDPVEMVIKHTYI